VTTGEYPLLNVFDFVFGSLKSPFAGWKEGKERRMGGGGMLACHAWAMVLLDIFSC
jgi:hypothetical protein